MPIDYFTFDPELELYCDIKEIGCYYLNTDLSSGAEAKPISVVNEVDDSAPTPFDYVNYTTFSSQINFDKIPIRPGFAGKDDEDPEHPFDLAFNTCCDCLENCQDPELCSCQRLNQSEQRIIYPDYPSLSYGYTHRKLVDRVYTGIYECNINCSCNNQCPNRLVQLGIRNRLQLFKTAETGWGIRPLHDVPKGSFLCQYIAKVLTPEQGNDGERDDTYFAELDLIDDMEGSKQVNNEGSYPVDFVDPGNLITVEKAGRTPYIPLRTLLETPYSYVVDAFKRGNIGRFFNHSCEANVSVQNVFLDTHDPRFYAIALFSNRTIKAFEELRWDYGYQAGLIEGRVLYCKCGSKKCRGRLL
jgi:histone-lysine N-methyltransferase SETDB1